MSILPVPTGFVELKCGGTLQTLKVYGTFLVAAGKINEPHKILNLNAKQSKGKQEFLEYENEKNELFRNTLETEGSGLKTFAKEPSAEEAAEEATFEEEVEFVL